MEVEVEVETEEEGRGKQEPRGWQTPDTFPSWPLSLREIRATGFREKRPNKSVLVSTEPGLDIFGPPPPPPSPRPLSPPPHP